MQAIGVITADIVNSTALSSKLEKSLFREFQSLLPENGIIEFYRGDSFQMLVPDAGNALNVLLQLRACAKKITKLSSTRGIVDVRAGLGIGAATGQKITKLSTAKGAPFLISGRGLDELGKTEHRTTILHESPNELVQTSFSIIARYCDTLFSPLTPKQSAVVLELLKGKTQQEVSTLLNKSQPTINRQAQAARWNDISKLLNDYKQILSLI